MKRDIDGSSLMYPSDRPYPDDPNSAVQWRLESFETANAHGHRRRGAAQLPWWSWLVPLVVGLTAVLFVALWSAPADGAVLANHQHNKTIGTQIDRLRDDALVRSQTARSLPPNGGGRS